MITSKNNTNSTTRIHSTSFIHSTNTPIMTRCLLSVAIASSLLLVGCNDDNDKIMVVF